MTDQPEEPDVGDLPPEEQSENQPPKQGTYRKCQACGMFIDTEVDLCPECGAYSDETEKPLPDQKQNLILSLSLVGILIMALILISASPNGRGDNIYGLPELGVIKDEGEEPQPGNPDPVATADPSDPLPRPKPTRPPRRPTPRPRPSRPTATPVFRPERPTPTPVRPTPTPTRSKTLELKEQLMREYRRQLDESHPVAKRGDFVRLTLRDGRLYSGTIIRLDNQQLLLETEAGRVWLVFRQLVPESRIRVDRNDRNARIEEKALQEVLRRLQEN